MREILFKAKRKDNSEWVEGNLITNERNENQKYIGYIFDERNGVIEDFDIVEVVPDTLCQYTGLKDKNGKKIWENDIIKTSQYGVDNGDGRNFAGFDIFSISFSEGSFCLMNKWRRFNLRLQRDMEVIGNIFDNPELLEVE